jgi:heme exporter protein D
MNWGSASEFFAMGGYGVYVWGSYAVTASAMLLEPLLAARRHARARRAALEPSDED